MEARRRSEMGINSEILVRFYEQSRGWCFELYFHFYEYINLLPMARFSMLSYTKYIAIE